MWYRPEGDEYKVSVTGFAFVSQLLHDEETKPPFPRKGGVAPKATEDRGVVEERVLKVQRVQRVQRGRYRLRR